MFIILEFDEEWKLCTMGLNSESEAREVVFRLCNAFKHSRERYRIAKIIEED